MIVVNNVVKSYGNRQVLKGISFQVEDGQIAGLLGPNGAGKSTTMGIIAGSISPTEGEVSVQGFDMADCPVDSRKQIGYLPDTPPLYDDMTVEEYLDFAARAKGMKEKESRRQALDEVIKKTGISGVAAKLIANLSRGFRQRVGLAQALLGSPSVLILDEPAAGLDLEQVREMVSLLQELRGEHTMIISSHFLSELQQICSKLIVMNDGEIILDEPVVRLTEQYEEKNRIRLTVKGDPEILAKTLEEAEFVKDFEQIPPDEVLKEDDIPGPGRELTLLIRLSEDDQARDRLFYLMAEKKMPIVHMETVRMSLEDVFCRLTAEHDNKEEEEGEE